MTDRHNILKRTSVSGAVGVLFIAAMGLLSYFSGLRVLGSIRGDYIPMAPATSISFILLALILLTLVFKPPAKTGLFICFSVAFFVSLFGFLEGLEHFAGKDLSCEDLLIPVAGNLAEIPIGRMSPLTGLGFFVSGFVVLVFLLQNKNSSHFAFSGHLAGTLGSLTFLAGSVFALAYLYGHPLLYGHGTTIPMALTTAIGFMLLGGALMGTAGRCTFPLNALTGSSTRAHLLRFILPLSTLSVVVSGWIILRTEHIQQINPALVSAVLIGLIAVVSGFLAMRASRHIGNQIDADNVAIQQAAEALQKSSERFQRAIMDAPFPAMIYAEDGEVLTVNNAWTIFSGYTVEDIPRITDWHLKAGSEPGTPGCALIDNLYEKNTSQHKGEIAVRARSGEPRFWDVYLSPLGRDDNNRRLVLNMAVDITDRKQMENKIAQMARFPGENPNPVMRFSADGTVLYANEASERLLPYLKQRDGKILPGNFDISFAEILSSGKALPQEIDCGEITYALTLAPLSDEGLLNLYAMDISIRKQAEKKLAELTENLRVSNRDLEQFAYIASHDLQEPLRMIANYMQLIERRYKDKLDEDARDFINYAVDGAVRMQQLIDSLLEYSRLQTRKRPFEPVDLNQVLQRVLRDLEGRILEAGVQVTADPLPHVIGDALQLGLVFQNLISNALKFRSEKSPEVHIAAEEFSKHWKVTVSDNGIGIEPEHQERIFNIFHRLHSRMDYPGTGIGLAICRRIIERHGGETGVESVLKKGSTFWFTLPKKGEK
ncbi:MAG: ATP-binding protein [Kiritimatiellales bacterium]